MNYQSEAMLCSLKLHLLETNQMNYTYFEESGSSPLSTMAFCIFSN